MFGVLGFGIQIPGMGESLSAALNKEKSVLSAPLYKGVHRVPYQGWNYSKPYEGLVEYDFRQV